jgi:hypothetical protein
VLNCYPVHMRNAARRWFKFHNVGASPVRRWAHAMASDGTRVFVLGGRLEGALSHETCLIHVFDTSMYFRSVISSGQPPRLRTQSTSSTRNPSVTLSILMRRPRNLRGSHPQVPPTEEQPQHPKSSSSEVLGASRLQNATPAISGHPASLQITPELNRGRDGRPLELTAQ